MIVRYQNVKITKEDQKSPEYFVNNIYPDIPVTEEDDYVITVEGDRLDLLASDFYGDVTMWWIIASANSLSGDSLYLEPGTQLRIPNNPMELLNDYKSFNASR